MFILAATPLVWEDLEFYSTIYDGLFWSVTCPIFYIIILINITFSMQVCVLLLDTEGENDVGTSQHQDMKIYCLTAMMSSVLVRY